jgi:sterol desaturase/sphingolipid hydroxylase (fatty acid hydroxylase superfamily)
MLLPVISPLLNRPAFCQFDLIFGTYYLPGKKWPAGTGVHEAQYPKGFVKQSIYPFTKSPFDTDLNMDERGER